MYIKLKLLYKLFIKKNLIFQECFLAINSFQEHDVSHRIKEQEKNSNKKKVNFFGSWMAWCAKNFDFVIVWFFLNDKIFRTLLLRCSLRFQLNNYRLPVFKIIIRIFWISVEICYLYLNFQREERNNLIG